MWRNDFILNQTSMMSNQKKEF